MKLRLLISLNLLLLWSWQPARAQLMSADDFFHHGAQSYITTNLPKAQEAVDMGLKFYPDDEKLKKLDALLKQQSQQQQQQQQQQQNQSQQQKDKQQSQSQKSDSQKDQPSPKDSQDQQKQDEQKQKEAEQKKADQQKQQEAQKSSADQQKDQQQQGEEQPATSGQITPEEAKRLLDAQKGNEQLLQMKPENKPRDFRRPAKDW